LILSSDVNVVCPKCEDQSVYPFSGPNKERVKCKKCSTDFSFLYATIRAKKSRGDRKANSREFDIRIYLNDGSEDFIQFVKSGWDDVELRSKDGVVFSFLGDKVRVIQNIQIGSFTSISEPSCYIATHVFGSYSSEVVFLRNWRDRTLSTYFLGRCIVSIYYSISPLLIKVFGGNKVFSMTMKKNLNYMLKSLGYKSI
jgi:hypothetical protein